MVPLRLVCVAVLLVDAAIAGVADHRACEEYPSVCTIHEVRIDPCSNPRSCRLKKGHPASISFDFTPSFTSNNITTGLFWASDTADIPFSELYEADACQFTSCPIENGKKQELTFTMHLSKKLPKGTYLFKWKLWNTADEKQICCFKTEIQLRK